MDNSLFIAIIILVALTIFFDFSNGFHDAANVVAEICTIEVAGEAYVSGVTRG